jgi:IclR family transcriptional regulator, mhp operon transcriptional activator
MPSFAPVRSVLRALDVLALIGRGSDGSVRDLSARSGLPKATVVRLLETLIEAGYVWKDPAHGEYRITEKVYQLSGSYNGPLLIQASRPQAIGLTRRFKWPVSVAVLDHDAMIILYTTMIESPISWKPSGQRLPLLTRALGRAYIGFCSPEQQRLILRILRTSTAPDDRIARKPQVCEQIFQTVRDSGFATRDPGTGPRLQSTLAVPIMVGGEPVASLGLTYYIAAVSPEDVAHYVAGLKEAAKSIGSAIEQRLPAGITGVQAAAEASGLPRLHRKHGLL